MNQIILIAHNIRSLFNVGSLFRSADCFGISKIYLTGYTARPPRKEITKTALGAELTIPWEYSRQLPRVIRKLQSEHVTVVALETSKHATPLPDFVHDIYYPPLTKGRIKEGFLLDTVPSSPLSKGGEIQKLYPTALLVGNEVTGLTKSNLTLCDKTVEIPMLGKKESLNVAIAASVAMYAIRYHNH